MISQDKKSLEILGFFSVFPACAGVSLGTIESYAFEWSFPRVCGGEPEFVDGIEKEDMFSPRVRG